MEHQLHFWSESEHLVFEMRDGRTIALMRNGLTFSYHDDMNLLSSGFDIQADSLAAYIDRRMDSGSSGSK